MTKFQKFLIAAISTIGLVALAAKLFGSKKNNQQGMTDEYLHRVFGNDFLTRVLPQIKNADFINQNNIGFDIVGEQIIFNKVIDLGDLQFSKDEQNIYSIVCSPFAINFCIGSDCLDTIQNKNDNNITIITNPGTLINKKYQSIVLNGVDGNTFTVRIGYYIFQIN